MSELGDRWRGDGSETCKCTYIYACVRDQNPNHVLFCGSCLAHTPREGKAASTMMIALTRFCNPQTPGLPPPTPFITICRQELCIEVAGDPATESVSPSPSPWCAVYASDHITAFYNCTTYSDGRKCPHPRILYANAQLHQGYRATRHSCPTKAKIQARASNELRSSKYE